MKACQERLLKMLKLETFIKLVIYCKLSSISFTNFIVHLTVNVSFQHKENINSQSTLKTLDHPNNFFQYQNIITCTSMIDRSYTCLQACGKAG